MMRPAIHSRATAVSILSTTSYSPSESTCTDETALTTPDLSSPQSKMGGFDLSFPSGAFPTASVNSLSTVQPDNSRREASKSASHPPLTSAMARGPSVKERASVFEAAGHHFEAPSPKMKTEGPAQVKRPKSTSPLRIGRRSPAHKAATGAVGTAAGLASPARRKPVPQVLDPPVAAQGQDENYVPLGLGVQFDPLSAGPSTQAVPSPVTPKSPATSSYFALGKEIGFDWEAGSWRTQPIETSGSARLMIQHWEKRPLDAHQRENVQTRSPNQGGPSQHLTSKPLPTPGKAHHAREPAEGDMQGHQARIPLHNDSNYAPMRTIDGWAGSKSVGPIDSDRLSTPLAAPRAMRTPSPTLSIRSGPSYGPDSPRPRRGMSSVSPIKGAISKFKDLGRRARDKGKSTEVLGGLLSTVAERKASKVYAPTEDGPAGDQRFGSAGLLNGIVYLDDPQNALPENPQIGSSDFPAENQRADTKRNSPDRFSLSADQQIHTSLGCLLNHVESVHSRPVSTETLRPEGENATQLPPRPMATVEREGQAQPTLDYPPATERELSIFSQAALTSAQQLPRDRARIPSVFDVEPIAIGKSPPPSTECVLDFDPADLNPSRSASQVRRPVCEPTTMAGAASFGVEEQAFSERQPGLEDENAVVLNRQLTHISRVTFPEPKIPSAISRPRQSPLPSHVDIADRLATMLPGNETAQEDQRYPTPDAGPPSRSPPNKGDYAGEEEHRLAVKLQAIQTSLQDLASKVDCIVDGRDAINRSSPSDAAQLNGRLASIEVAVQDTKNTLLLSRLADERLSRPPVIDESGLSSIHDKLESILQSCKLAEALAADLRAQSTSSGPGVAPRDRPIEPVIASLDPNTTGEEGKESTKTAILIADGPSTPRHQEPDTSRNTKSVKKSKAKGGLPPKAASPAGPVAASVSEDFGQPAATKEQMAGEEDVKVLSNVRATVADEGLEASKDPINNPQDQVIAEGLKGTTDKESKTLPVDSVKQLAEVLKHVAELNEARVLQSHNSNDIVKYLTKMDVWLETLVKNMGEGIESINSTLTGGIPQAGAAAATPSSLMGLIIDLQTTMKSLQANEVTRSEAFTAMIQENRQRMLGLTTVVEQMRAALSQQQAANEQMLQSLSADQKSIKGEMVRFVEAMKEAVAFDVEARVGRFEQLASQEVNKAISQVSDLSRQHGKLLGNMAVLHSMSAADAAQPLVSQVPRAITSADGTVAPVSKPSLPAGASRGLPPAPGAKGNTKGKK